MNLNPVRSYLCSMLPKKLQNKLDVRTANNSLRNLGEATHLIDFSSNDYLGFSSSKIIFNRASEILAQHALETNGATGSRLLSGNYPLYEIAEKQIANFHNAESALLFNSGYDANVGFFGSVPQRGDVIFYDELCHASIRDGIKLSNAKAYKFAHNNLEELRSKCQVERSRNLHETPEIYIVTESVFSMDGDSPDLVEIVNFCTKNNYNLIVDEAHAVGVLGDKGEGLVQDLGLTDRVFARLVTFGKALGCHGAAILGSQQLRTYLINFARSFIYTTALPPHSVATIIASFEQLAQNAKAREDLHNNIVLFHDAVAMYTLESYFVLNNSAIQTCLIPGNTQVKKTALHLQDLGFDVRPILSPTVPMGKERLRFCLHNNLTAAQIETLLKFLKQSLSNV